MLASKANKMAVAGPTMTDRKTPEFNCLLHQTIAQTPFLQQHNRPTTNKNNHSTCVVAAVLHVAKQRDGLQRLAKTLKQCNKQEQKRLTTRKHNRLDDRAPFVRTTRTLTFKCAL
jgi:hypothetical protein